MGQRDKFSILYVARTADDAILLETALGMVHVSVTLVHTIADAISVLKERPVDLCLMETRLPDGDGFELCRKMRKAAPGVPIIFYSGDAADGYRRMGLEAGANEYLVKPNFDSLTDTVTSYLRARINGNGNGHAASGIY